MSKKQTYPTSLETALASYHGFEYVITVRSTKDAFYMAMRAGGLEHKDAVICSPNAPLPFFRALYDLSLLPVYNDLRLNGSIEERFLERTLTSETKAVILAHNNGQLSPSDVAHNVTEKHNLLFIEDATEVLQTHHKSGASLVVHSLSSLPTLQYEEGAYIATQDQTLAKELIKIREGGYVTKKLWNYDLINTQENLQLSPLIADVAFKSISSLPQHQKRLQEIAAVYMDELSTSKLIELPHPSDLAPYHHFPIWLVPALFCPKEDIYQALVDAGIDIEVGNKPIYKTTAFKDESLSLFGAEEVFKSQLLLPSHHLMRDEDIIFVVETLEQLLDTYSYRGCSF